MHIGNRNIECSYSMDGQWLNQVEEEKDLGVVFSKDLKSSKQCIEAKNKAMKMLGLINRNVAYKSKEVITKLYNSYVRPLLEYCIQAWSPHYRRDIEMLEKVQRRATKMVTSLRHLSYEERLKELNMFSLKRRYLRGDLIEVYKMFNGLDKVDFNDYFTLDEDRRTRGHSRKIKKFSCRLDVKKYSFAHLVVDGWNSLPEEVVTSESLEIFKKRLDHHMESGGQMIQSFINT